MTMSTNTDNINHLALAAGTRIGYYVIESLLGQGSFSLVYLALDENLNCKIALKEYLPSGLATRTRGNTVSPQNGKHLLAFEEGRARFIEEARLLAQLDHPAIVRVQQVFEANETAYMAMPYYQGETLKDFQLRTDNKLWREDELKELLPPLLDALGLLHRSNILHRDISPDNIFIKDNGQPMLIDFGAARRVIGEMTESIFMLVKVGYSPIEQYSTMGKTQAGPWSDIYSLAAVVYELVSGEKVYGATDRVPNDQMPTLAERKPHGFSKEFVKLIDKALSVRIEHRPQSVADWHVEQTKMQTILPETGIKPNLGIDNWWRSVKLTGSRDAKIFLITALNSRPISILKALVGGLTMCLMALICVLILFEIPASEIIPFDSLVSQALVYEFIPEVEMIPLPTGISMSKYEVTQGQWREVMNETPSIFKECGNNCPVENVSWNDVQNFIEKLNRQSGKHYRLPSEDEWFESCQAGEESKYCGSERIENVAWYYLNTGNMPSKVGGKDPNAWGLYDMSGNVWEWTNSCFGFDCSQRIARGGSWTSDSARLLAVDRLVFDATDRTNNLGFRLVLDD